MLPSPSWARETSLLGNPVKLVGHMARLGPSELLVAAATTRWRWSHKPDETHDGECCSGFATAEGRLGTFVPVPLALFDSVQSDPHTCVSIHTGQGNQLPESKFEGTNLFSQGPGYSTTHS